MGNPVSRLMGKTPPPPPVVPPASPITTTIDSVRGVPTAEVVVRADVEADMRQNVHEIEQAFLTRYLAEQVAERERSHLRAVEHADQVAAEMQQKKQQYQQMMHHHEDSMRPQAPPIPPVNPFLQTDAPTSAMPMHLRAPAAVSASLTAMHASNESKRKREASSENEAAAERPTRHRLNDGTGEAPPMFAMGIFGPQTTAEVEVAKPVNAFSDIQGMGKVFGPEKHVKPPPVELEWREAVQIDSFPVPTDSPHADIIASEYALWVTAVHRTLKRSLNCGLMISGIPGETFFVTWSYPHFIWYKCNDEDRKETLRNPDRMVSSAATARQGMPPPSVERFLPGMFTPTAMVAREYSSAVVMSLHLTTKTYGERQVQVAKELESMCLQHPLVHKEKLSEWYYHSIQMRGWMCKLATSHSSHTDPICTALQDALKELKTAKSVSSDMPDCAFKLTCSDDPHTVTFFGVGMASDGTPVYKARSGHSFQSYREHVKQSLYVDWTFTHPSHLERSLDGINLQTLDIPTVVINQSEPCRTPAEILAKLQTHISDLARKHMQSVEISKDKIMSIVLALSQLSDIFSAWKAHCLKWNQLVFAALNPPGFFGAVAPPAIMSLSAPPRPFSTQETLRSRDGTSVEEISIKEESR